MQSLALLLRDGPLAPREPYGVVPCLERSAEESLDDSSGPRRRRWSVILEPFDRPLPLWMDASLRVSQHGPRPELSHVSLHVFYQLDSAEYSLEHIPDCHVVSTIKEVVLGLLGLLALGTLEQLWTVVHIRIPGFLSGQRREESHELLESKGSHGAVADVGDAPALFLLCMAVRDGGPPQHVQDVLHLLWSEPVVFSSDSSSEAESTMRS
jgi:hypothetical protein